MLKQFIIGVTSIAVLTFGVATPALAQGQDDFRQPIKINADNESFDIKQNLAIFTNNVVIQQGTLRIEAEKLIAERDRERQVEIFVASGNPATYQQQLEDGSLITAQADEIRYDQLNQILTLSGNAEVNQNDSLVRGGVLRYDFNAQVLTSERSEDNKQQVETIIMPRNNEREGDNGNNDQPPADNGSNQ